MKILVVCLHTEPDNCFSWDLQHIKKIILNLIFSPTEISVRFFVIIHGSAIRRQ